MEINEKNVSLYFTGIVIFNGFPYCHSHLYTITLYLTFSHLKKNGMIYDENIVLLIQPFDM